MLWTMPAAYGPTMHFGDRGWLAIALVIFTIWRPNLSVLASFLFGGLYILYLYIPTGMDHMEYQELIQNDSVCGNTGGTGSDQHPQQARESAACKPGTGILPRRAIIELKRNEVWQNEREDIYSDSDPGR